MNIRAEQNSSLWHVGTLYPAKPSYKTYVSMKIFSFITIVILDIIHRPVFYLKHNGLEIGVSGPETETSSTYRAQLRRFLLKTETDALVFRSYYAYNGSVLGYTVHIYIYICFVSYKAISCNWVARSGEKRWCPKIQGGSRKFAWIL
jgi:hypothetical protein